jgi:hypothetical protein
LLGCIVRIPEEKLFIINGDVKYIFINKYIYIYIYIPPSQKKYTSQKFSISVFSALCATQGGKFRKIKFPRVTA